MIEKVEENMGELEAALQKVTHDLRTPLTVLKTTTSMLLNPKYQLTPEQVREQHERLRRNVDLLAHELDELSTVVNRLTGKRPPATG
jgi:signal transduction histidine kinase